MNEKFNKNAKVEKFTSMLGIAVRLIVIGPLMITYQLEIFPTNCPYNSVRISIYTPLYTAFRHHM